MASAGVGVAAGEAVRGGGKDGKARVCSMSTANSKTAVIIVMKRFFVKRIGADRPRRSAIVSTGLHRVSKPKGNGELHVKGYRNPNYFT